MARTLKERAIKGAVWSAAQKFGVMGMSFVANMILARKLTPDDFGCIAMLAIFIVVCDTFMDGGLGSAVIQKKELNRSDISTAFFFNLLLACVLYAGLFAAAPAIASFYNQPILQPILRVEGLILVINSFGVMQTSILRKEMLFKKIAKANITASILSASAAIVMAFCGVGIWTLVYQQILLAAVRVLMLWNLSEWRPQFVFSRGAFKELFGFGSFIFLSNLVNNICNNVQAVIIGKAFNANVLGFYTQAKNLEQVASTSFSTIIDQVSYPALASKQDDREAMQMIIEKFVKIISFVTIPLMGLLALLSQPIIEFCYGSNWLPSVPYFKVLCVAGIAISLQGVNFYAVAAIGRSKSLFWWTLFKRAGGIVLILVGLIWGMPGLLAGVVGGSFLILAVNAYQVQMYIGYRVFSQFASILLIGIGTVIAYFVAGNAQFLISNHLAAYAVATITFIAIVVVYYSLTCRSLVNESKNIIITVFNRKK